MDFSNVWFWVMGIAVLALVGLFLLTRSEVRKGRTPPGPLTGVDAGTHDEPDTDVARHLDEKRHMHSPDDVSKSARDAGRTLGH